MEGGQVWAVAAASGKRAGGVGRIGRGVRQLARQFGSEHPVRSLDVCRNRGDAEFERSLIQERVRAGLRNAKAKDQQLGRPQRIVNRDTILRQKAEGASLRQIAGRLGIGYGTVRARLVAS